MCGLIGFSGPKPFDPLKIKILLLYNESRGNDSTGYWTPKEDIKKAIDDALLYLSKWPEIEPCDRFIGHCRKSSMGGVTKQNAHPFEFDNIIGAHNGHIPGIWKYITDDEKDYFDLEIDSQALFYLLSKKKNPSFLYYGNIGAMAILFTDKRDNIIYAFRNKERPLYYGTSEEGMYMSSIKESLKAIKCVDIKEFNLSTLYCIQNGNIEKTIKIDIPRTNEKKTKFKEGWYMLIDDIHAVEGKFTNKNIGKKGERIFVKQDKDKNLYFESSTTHTDFTITNDMFEEIPSTKGNLTESVIETITETTQQKENITEALSQQEETDMEYIITTNDMLLLTDEICDAVMVIGEEYHMNVEMKKAYEDCLKESVSEVFNNFIMATT